MTKAELLAAIDRDWDRLQSLVERVGDARMTEPSLEAGWSVKDVLAHIALWEGICARWLEAAARGETPERPEVKDVDGTNARGHERAKSRPLTDVVNESRTRHARIVAAAEALPEEELVSNARFGWPVWQMTDSNTAEHYREHIDQISRWLASPPA
jgi:uncharacterized protein (TIGR03083 family)